MIRKLIKQGSTSLVVSLPIEWIRSNKLTVGDEVEIFPQEYALAIRTKGEKKVMKCVLNVDSVDEMSLYVNLLNLYRKGFDEVKIISNSNKIMDFETNKHINTLKSVQQWLSRFIGWEIITQDPIVIKDITGESSEDPEKLLKRVFFLLNSFVDEEIAAINNKNQLPDPQEFYMTTFKMVNYAIRTYNKRSQTSYNVILLQQLHAISQQLRNIQPYLNSNKNEIVPILKILRPALNLYNTDELSLFIKQHHLVGLELLRPKLNANLLRMLLRLHDLYMDVAYTINFLQLKNHD